MVVFRGAEAFISPNWYPSKHEAHRQVPTWNYEVVHAHGKLTVHDDERFVRGLVARLTRQHEAAEPRPWKMSDSAPEFIDAMLRNIVGIEVAITSLVGKSSSARTGRHVTASRRPIPWLPAGMRSWRRRCARRRALEQDAASRG